MSKSQGFSIFRPKNSAFWYISYTDPRTNQREKKTLKTTIKERAKEYASKIYNEAWGQKNLGEPISWTVRELLQWHLERHLRGKERFDESNHQSMIKRPMVTFGDISANALKTDTILGYIAIRRSDVKNATINRELSPFRAAYSLAVKTDGMLLKNPFSGVSIFKERARERSASPQEKKSYLEGSTGLLHNVIEFDFAQGLDAGQIRRLEWSHVDFERQRIRLSRWKGRKGERYDYWMPIFPEGKAVLDRLPRIGRFVFCNEDGGPITTYGILHTAFARLTERLGIPDFHFHDIRHTFATDYYRLTKDLSGLSFMIGHKNPKTTQIYINRTPLDILEDRMSAVSSAAERLLDTEKVVGSIPAPRTQSENAPKLAEIGLSSLSSISRN